MGRASALRAVIVVCLTPLALQRILLMHTRYQGRAVGIGDTRPHSTAHHAAQRRHCEAHGGREVSYEVRLDVTRARALGEPR
jgi:hypothetical protein